MGPRTLHAPTRATRGTAHRARVPCDRSPTTRPRSATWIWCSRRNAAHARGSIPGRSVRANRVAQRSAWSARSNPHARNGSSSTARRSMFRTSGCVCAEAASRAAARRPRRASPRAAHGPDRRDRTQALAVARRATRAHVTFGVRRRQFRQFRRFPLRRAAQKVCPAVNAGGANRISDGPCASTGHPGFRAAPGPECRRRGRSPRG